MDLPVTNIGLFAFMLVVFAGSLKYLADQHQKSMEKTIDTFMTYIKEKNGNLERVSANFAAAMEKANQRLEACIQK